MTHVNLRAGLAGCAVAASALLLTSCTSGSSDGGAANKTSSPPTVSASQAAAKQKKLTEQAQADLAAIQSGTMVEAGAERVTDGIHTEPTMRQGKSYKINLVCIGSGNAHMTFTPANTGPKTEVPCDHSVVQQRITAHKLPVRIDVDGAKGSAGVIAWRIETV